MSSNITKFVVVLVTKVSDIFSLDFRKARIYAILRQWKIRSIAKELNKNDPENSTDKITYVIRTCLKYIPDIMSFDLLIDYDLQNQK